MHINTYCNIARWILFDHHIRLGSSHVTAITIITCLYHGERHEISLNIHTMPNVIFCLFLITIILCNMHVIKHHL